MNIYQVIFIIFFLWSSIFTVSVSVYNFKIHQYFSAINALVLQITASVLSIIYLF